MCVIKFFNASAHMRVDEPERQERRAERVIPCLLRVRAGQSVPSKTQNRGGGVGCDGNEEMLAGSHEGGTIEKSTDWNEGDGTNRIFRKKRAIFLYRFLLRASSTLFICVNVMMVCEAFFSYPIWGVWGPRQYP